MGGALESGAEPPQAGGSGFLPKPPSSERGSARLIGDWHVARHPELVERASFPPLPSVHSGLSPPVAAAFRVFRVFRGQWPNRASTRSHLPASGGLAATDVKEEIGQQARASALTHDKPIRGCGILPQMARARAPAPAHAPSSERAPARQKRASALTHTKPAYRA
jgi:hypothetical protein